MAEIITEEKEVRKVPEKGVVESHTKSASDLDAEDVSKALEVFQKKINR